MVVKEEKVDKRKHRQPTTQRHTYTHALLVCAINFRLVMQGDVTI